MLLLLVSSTLAQVKGDGSSLMRSEVSLSASKQPTTNMRVEFYNQHRDAADAFRDA